MSARGVEVITLIKSNFEKEERLRKIGVSIKINDALAIDVAIFDKSLIWYGSVNYLGYNTDENNAIRIYDALYLTLIFSVANRCYYVWETLRCGSVNFAIFQRNNFDNEGEKYYFCR